MTKEPSAQVARKLLATKRVDDLAEFMCQDAPDGLGLWKEKGHAALFLAGYAALLGKKPVALDKKNPKHKLHDLVNYYSLQKSISDIGELAAVHLAVGKKESVDHTLIDVMPGLMEAGADLLEHVLRGPEPFESVISLLRKAR